MVHTIRRSRLALLRCYGHRRFIVTSIKNEFVVRFAESKLGALWAVIHPLSQVLVFALVLSNVLSAKLPGIDSKYAYAIYLMAGILCWSLFAEIISRSTRLFIDNAGLLKKIKFPKLALPFIVLGSSLFNFMLLLIASVVVFLFLGHSFNLSTFWLIPITASLAIFSIAIGLILGVLNVFVRDIDQGVPIVLQLLFWFTPIVYPISIIPESYRWLLAYNPVYPFVDAFQRILVNGLQPDYEKLSFSMIFICVLVVIAAKVYSSASEEIVDVL